MTTRTGACGTGRRSREGLRLVEQALRAGPAGPYALQAAIAAVHAEAPTAADTDWSQIAGLYEELYRRQPTPVVALNRAAAVAMAFGPAQGLDLVDDLAERGILDGYYLLHATRADLLRRLGRAEQAAGGLREGAGARDQPGRASLPPPATQRDAREPVAADT